MAKSTLRLFETSLTPSFRTNPTAEEQEDTIETGLTTTPTELTLCYHCPEKSQDVNCL